ncbi:MAG: hypothetical protein KDB35_22215 [Acidimicrobiales bacterium]|nr:hypothetical protein [Acidimicrobiales bacterium]MCB1013633.1 hypothetical protein [Acidimicrobiales bacterium]MCB9374010.1 hypothetical protein [Microthrixaceae bacterium]
MSLLARVVVLADIPDPSDTGSGPSPVLAVVGVALLVAAVVGVVLLLRRSRRRP